jgi:hypothetical protein
VLTQEDVDRLKEEEEANKADESENSMEERYSELSA